VDRLKQWSGPGLLCIGDAAKAMSPVGAVGINLAIQDAAAAANLLAAKLTAGSLRDSDLLAVQRRREFRRGPLKGSKYWCKTK
jgi:2-polyprenyl-6-methoxyphenol hydroxylase-like FAD-dependent oxidoreductase